jgi:hypothetical protein
LRHPLAVANLAPSDALYKGEITMIKLTVKGIEHSLDVEADTPHLWVVHDYLSRSVAERVYAGRSLRQTIS